MNRIWTFFFDTRVLTVLGLAMLAAFLFLGAEALKLTLIWAVVALAAFGLVWAIVWGVRKLHARHAGRALEHAIESQGTKPTDRTKRVEVAALRERMQEAIKTIKGSKLGQLTGAGALYELPWYMVIGNPAAGKSTAVVKSGLTFPFAADGEAGNAASRAIQGIGGTRNCDWFFTSEGILLDTAGRYSVHEEDRGEWLGFLDLLKKFRPKAPINGIVIAVSAADLAHSKPEQAIALANNLRQRMQEITERLEVFAPVYLMFTKADLIAGFAEFFEDSERSERERVWGATLPYEQGESASVLLSQFDSRFEELTEGLREMSLARMSLARGQALAPGVLAFPLEFAALKTSLRAFVATLFEDNPYQFRPVFRGFYFTSAVQQGTSTRMASEQVAQQFGLQGSIAERTTALIVSDVGFFLKDLFSKVVFGDKNLVRQYASRRKLQWRTAALVGGVMALALALGGWSWAYLGNRQLMSNVRADLEKAVKLQSERSDLASRMEALELLQDRIVQLARHRASPPLGVSLGLYQGDVIEAKLREEYFAGVRQVMLQPVAQAIEGYLAEVNAHPARLKPMARTPESGSAQASNSTKRSAAGTRFVDASVEDSADAYNALKTYLMLADRQRLEPSHLTDQITRFWRGWLDDNRGTMPREQMIRSAESLISFTTANLTDPAFPTLSNQLALVDQTRENLREVVRGMRGIERVYADVKARAATRFAPITVAGLMTEADKGVLAGSHAVPGPFTREAWDGYIEQAFKEAASNELQSVDWVLKTSARDDLTLEGSPEQIRKELTELYKKEYVVEWQRFMQGVTVAEFGNFEQAVDKLNRLGEPQQSPIRRLMQLLFDQTSWDNPSLLNERLASTQRGAVEWFKQTVLRQAPSRVDVNLNIGTQQAKIPLGPIGREFAPLSRIMMTRDNSTPPITEYLQSLAKVRTRFNQIKAQGDSGPGARQLIGQTLDGGSSELAETLRFVDERLLVGMTDSTRASLRQLLVRPLVQALAVAIPPAETELNRIWAAQVSDPFQRTLAAKFPFDAGSRVEAGPAEIAKVFGPDGAVAKFAGESLGPLVVRRGDTIEARKWAELGVRLRPELLAGFGAWVSPLEGPNAGGGGSSGSGSVGGASAMAAVAAAAGADQTLFQVQPLGAPGLSEYTLVIDGQTLRYRNTAPEWVQMVWPNPAGVAGARLQAVTHDGRSVELVNEPGANGLTRLFETAQRRKLADGSIELAWTKDAHRVALLLKVLRAPGEAPRTAPAVSARSGAATNQAALPIAGNRLKGITLPALVVGSDAPVMASAAAVAAPTVAPVAAAARPASAALARRLP